MHRMLKTIFRAPPPSSLCPFLPNRSPPFSRPLLPPPLCLGSLSRSSFSTRAAYVHPSVLPSFGLSLSPQAPIETSTPSWTTGLLALFGLGSALLLSLQDKYSAQETSGNESHKLLVDGSNVVSAIQTETEPSSSSSSSSPSWGKSRGDIDRAGTSVFFLILELLEQEFALFFAAIIGTLVVSGLGVLIPSSTVEVAEIIRSIASNPRSASSSTTSLFSHLSPHLSKLYLPFSKFFAIILSEIAVSSLNYWLISKFSERIGFHLKMRIMDDLLYHKDIEFFDVGSKAEQLTKLSSDTQDIQSSIRHIFTMGLRSLFSSIGSFYTMYSISPSLTLSMALLLPSMVAVGTLIASHLHNLSRLIHQFNAESTAVAIESVNNIRTVKAFANEEKELSKFSFKLQQSMEKLDRFSGGLGLFRALTQAAGSGIALSIFLIGGYLVSQGQMKVADLSTFSVHTSSLFKSFEQIASVYTQSIRACVSLNQIAHLLATGPLRDDGTFVPSSIRGEIEFRDVDFCYSSRPDSQVLRHFSLKVPEGKVIAIVGESGSGKSTSISLLEKFYRPTRGTITIDGIDLSKINTKWVRKHIGIVSQEPQLFNGTIQENIRYGNLEASDQEIIIAAQRANCFDFVSNFPDGFQTQIGELGVQLSGGQKQRIAIARALLRDPKILILDEATSSLDSESEQLVQQTLENLMEGRTTIVVAHRLSTVRDADRIVVLNKGVIVEEGTHDQLMQNSAYYFRLVSHQLVNSSQE